MDASSPFEAWANFYVIVGSSAGALTGLQFVVMALVAERPIGTLQEVNAFGTPTVVHFSATLLISAILAAPWHRLGSAGCPSPPVVPSGAPTASSSCVVHAGG